MKYSLILCTVLALLGPPSATAHGGDWPMYRYDAGRTAASPDELPATLHLQWIRELPAPQTAWPASQVQLQFDAGYEPVVAGARLFVGSTVHDSVTAYDVRSGEELWRFVTDGPVRFAPVAVNDRVYAVSDDGFLYCLSAAAGELLWKVDGGPPRRRLIIGNERLISTWPARGGTVVRDGVVYFTAGIWPSMGCFLHAVDAVTGKILWTNDETSSLFITHPHGASSFGSISPQGYLALSGDRVIVPGGRTLPAVFDATSGKLEHFDFGGKGAGHYSIAAGIDFYTTRRGQFDLADGKEKMQAPAAVIAPQGLIGNKDRATISVTSTSGETQVIDVKDRRGNTQKKAVFTPDLVRTFEMAVPGDVQLSAGGRVYVAGGGKVAAYELERALAGEGEIEPSWSAEIEGEVWTMIAAAERLFVVTRDSRVYCFGAEPPRQVVTWANEPKAAAAGSVHKPLVQALLEQAGTSEGIAVLLGGSSPAFVRELAVQSNFQTIVIDERPAAIDAVRRDAIEAGLYGTRIAAFTADPLRAPLPPYLANLLVCESYDADLAERISSVYDVLRPYGGVACFRTTPQQHAELSEAVAQAELANTELARDGEWTILRKVGALPDAGTWTHQYADATNSVVSSERRVKAPLGILWFGGPSNDDVLPRHGHGPSPQVAGGRLFIEGPDMLRCVDVYTGRVWWQREFPGLGDYYNNTSHQPGAGEIGSNYVSLEDAVYVVYGEKILALDPETGETRRELTIAGAKSQQPFWGTVHVSGDVLVATANPVAVEGEQPAPRVLGPPGSKALIPPNAKWSYLAGSDPPADWTKIEFSAKQWKTGTAGFGYGDNDDRTVLSDMRGNYSRVYTRIEFDGRELSSETAAHLVINYDDAFIAYLNGREILRKNVDSGAGAQARTLRSHEATGHESFRLPEFGKLLSPEGRNVLAIEGHNAGANSSDFTLDAYLVAGGEAAPQSDRPAEAAPALTEALKPTRYSSASTQLIAFNRHTGEQLWTRQARFSFRHNTVCLAAGKVFCIDGLSPARMDLIRRRGIAVSEPPELLALDLQTGEVRWSTTEDVFGTFLNYSSEHDILLQGGSAYRDRAKDEVSRGLVAYRAADGEVLWKDLEISYSGPCLLWRDKIITNGGGGFQLDLFTGQPTGWVYRRMYGCNTAIGCETMLTFRSGSAGFFDLDGDSGTGNLGGFRSSCTSNLIPADGVLNAPDFTRTCTCAYQLQSSLAFIHMPEAEVWTFNDAKVLGEAPENFAVNLGAPGDRRDENGLLWLEYPVVGGPSPEIKLDVEPEQGVWYRRHTAFGGDGPLRWIGVSGVRGVRKLSLELPASLGGRKVRVSLVFAEPDDAQPGERRFDVAIQEKTALTNFDIAASAESAGAAVVREFTTEIDGERLSLTFTPAADSPRREAVLCGIAVRAE